MNYKDGNAPKIGDLVRLVDADALIAEKGMLAEVCELHDANYFISIKWAAKTTQAHGWYNPNRFVLLERSTAEIEPKNNDGRSMCFWCRGPTSKKLGFIIDEYDYCEKCKR